MARLELCEYPHPILKEKAQKVKTVDDNLRLFLDDMLETMYAEQGVGLAAPQVGVSKRVVVIDVSGKDEPDEPYFMINPEIIWHSKEVFCNEEGCLSVPDMRADVDRYEQVRVRYLDYNGKEQEILAEDFFSIAIQHEIDHLDGILYIDRISRLKRQMLLKKLQKTRLQAKEE